MELFLSFFCKQSLCADASGRTFDLSAFKTVRWTERKIRMNEMVLLPLLSASSGSHRSDTQEPAG